MNFVPRDDNNDAPITKSIFAIVEKTHKPMNTYTHTHMTLLIEDDDDDDNDDK